MTTQAATSYGVPTLLALLVHALVFSSLFVVWTKPIDLHEYKPPPVVKAKLVMMEAPKPKAPPPKATPPPPEVKPTPPKATPPPEVKPAPAKVTPKPAPVVPKKDPAVEKARQERAEADKRKRLDALLASAFDEAKKEEASALDRSADEEAVQTFAQGIYQLIIANWSRPPSARNGMETKLMVDLVPTGSVVGVTIVSSSGNAAFDRSAELAVRKAAKFDVPSDPAVFERYFRKLPITFNPGDLLR
jgi:colicin import membrane protein